MAENSAIGWTEHTWNPWQGCTKVSAGCDLCYMFREKIRYGQDPATVVRSKERTFSLPLRLKEPGIIFTCSWSDFFHKAADPWRADAWRIIRDTPQHIYQILTKRPGRIHRHLPDDWGQGYRNVWLGTSVESQEFVSRIEQILAIPAALHWISAEPLLGPLNIMPYLAPTTHVVPFREADGRARPMDTETLAALNHMARAVVEAASTQRYLRWVVPGGESGQGCRPMELDWVRDIRDQCQSAGVPMFLKQLGGYPDARKDEAAVLDGRTWQEMPPRPNLAPIGLGL